MRAVRLQRVGLNEHTLKFDCLQQLAQGLDLVTGIGDCPVSIRLMCALNQILVGQVTKVVRAIATPRTWV